MIIEDYENLTGTGCVKVTYEDGTVWSGLKSAWEEMQAQAEEGGTL